MSPAASVEDEIAIPGLDFKEAASDDVGAHHHAETVDLDDLIVVLALDFQCGNSSAGRAAAMESNGAGAGKAKLA